MRPPPRISDGVGPLANYGLLPIGLRHASKMRKNPSRCGWSNLFEGLSGTLPQQMCRHIDGTHILPLGTDRSMKNMRRGTAGPRSRGYSKAPVGALWYAGTSERRPEKGKCERLTGSGGKLASGDGLPVPTPPRGGKAGKRMTVIGQRDGRSRGAQPGIGVRNYWQGRV